MEAPLLRSLSALIHFALDWRLFLLIGAANAVPIIARNVFGPRFAFPLDGDLNFCDGQRLLGSAKTLRGILLPRGDTCAVVLFLVAELVLSRFLYIFHLRDQPC